MAVTPSHDVRRLLDLVDALDRRVPQAHRAGEAAIALDAASLRARAVQQIEELERDQASADPL